MFGLGVWGMCRMTGNSVVAALLVVAIAAVIPE